MALDGIETRKQENCSRIFLESWIEQGVEPSYAQLKKTYDKIDPIWQNSFRAQAIAMKNWLKDKKHKKGFNYSRDDGIMPEIVRIATQYCGVSTKDNWNTMDIVMVLKTEEKKILAEMEKVCSNKSTDKAVKKVNLMALNTLMRKYFKSGTLYGVSLKKVEKLDVALLEVSNLDEPGTTDIYGEVTPGIFEFVKGALKCDLEVSGGMFLNGEAAGKFTVNGKVVNFQHRNFRNKDQRGVVQTDCTAKFSSAKLGKVPAGLTKAFLDGLGIDKPESPTQDPWIPAVGKWEKSHIDYWVKFYNSIKSDTVAGAKVDFGNVQATVGKKVNKGFEECLVTAIANEKKDINAAGRLSSKLVAMRWIQAHQLIDKMDLLEKWASIFYYGSKKEGGETNGVFIKLSD
jgi:hypothetical protein